MSENTHDYEQWKTEMNKALDDLVARNFERLYLSKISDYDKIWGEISRELHNKYGLLGVAPTDPQYDSKRQKQHCIYMNVRIYSEDEFPTELSTDRVYRFVKQYEKLPKQAPEEWDKFELEQRAQAGRERNIQRERFSVFLKQFAAAHPEYAHR